MEAIRLFHIRHYDRRRKRFRSTAFTYFGEGISIIEKQCIITSSMTICEHIRTYYPTTASEPPIFWIFSTDILPAPSIIVPTISTTGDHCHYDIRQLSDNQRRNVFEKHAHNIASLRICSSDGSHQVPTVEQLHALSLEAERLDMSDH